MTQELSDLIQQAASAVTLTGPEDLDEMKKLQGQLDAIAKQLGELSELPEAIRKQAASASESAGHLVEALLGQEQSDVEDTLRVVGEVICGLQRLNDQIEKGIAGDQIRVAFPEAVAEPAAGAATEAGRGESSETPAAPAEPGADPDEADGRDGPQADAGSGISGAGADADVATAGTVIDSDDVEMVNDFITEAQEHIESIEGGLLELENAPDDPDAINLVFRGFHTIKGMAGFLNLSDIQSLAHAAENVLDLGRKQELQLVGETTDIVFESVDVLKQMLEALNRAVASGSAVEPCEGLSDLLARLKACAEGRPVGQAVTPSEDNATGQAESGQAGELEAGQVGEPGTDVPADSPAVAGDQENATAAEKVDEAKADSCDVAENSSGAGDQAGGQPTAAVSAKDASSPSQPVATAKASPSSPPKRMVADEKIKVSTTRLDNLVNMVGELVIAQSMVYQVAGTLVSQDHDLLRTVSHQGKIVRELQELSMMMRMVPIQGVFQKMARLVRDLSQKSGKKVVFASEGEDTELDRIVVDQIGDPLVHMVRNSVDHGIEPEEERIKAGKDPIGRVFLRAFHQAGSIVIQIEDDGRGLDKDRILQKAIDQGLVSPGQEMTDSEIYKLIFHAGLSTAKQVTDISGRGVGMDVVRKNIEALRGKIDIESELGKGTTFTIRLPLTMAIIDGQLVRIGSTQYVVPIMTIESCVRPTQSQISTVQGRAEMVMFQGRLIPMVRLYELFGVQPDSDVPWESSLVVVEEDGLRGCLMVDEVLGQQQVVIKSLGEGVGQIPGIAGGAIMGDGRISLILDIPGLLKLAAGDVG